MEEVQPKAFVYQAGALVPRPTTSADATCPWHVKAFRAMVGALGGLTPVLEDHKGALQFIQNHPLATHVIVTRPGLLVKGKQPHEPKTLQASADVAELYPITYQDLAIIYRSKLLPN
jgi:hypothetical protein